MPLTWHGALRLTRVYHAPVMIGPEIRTKVLEALKAGRTTMEVARQFHLSILTVAEIAGGKQAPTKKHVRPKSPGSGNAV